MFLITKSLSNMFASLRYRRKRHYRSFRSLSFRYRCHYYRWGSALCFSLSSASFFLSLIFFCSTPLFFFHPLLFLYLDFFLNLSLPLCLIVSFQPSSWHYLYPYFSFPHNFIFIPPPNFLFPTFLSLGLGFHLLWHCTRLLFVIVNKSLILHCK